MIIIWSAQSCIKQILNQMSAMYLSRILSRIHGLTWQGFLSTDKNKHRGKSWLLWKERNHLPPESVFQNRPPRLETQALQQTGTQDATEYAGGRAENGRELAKCVGARGSQSGWIFCTAWRHLAHPPLSLGIQERSPWGEELCADFSRKRKWYSGWEMLRGS